MATLPLFEQPASTGTIHGNTAIIARERQKSLMLRAWILSGLFFMTLPGTLLGFSNLMAISALHGLGTLPAAWMEGHGHAQVFGWIGSFILGIGFIHSPRMDGQFSVFLSPATSWTSGVGCGGSQTSMVGIGVLSFPTPRDLNSSRCFCFSPPPPTISCLTSAQGSGKASGWNSGYFRPGRDCRAPCPP